MRTNFRSLRPAVALVLLAAACGSPSARTSARDADETDPESVLVTCHEDGSTTLSSHTVAARADGVHVDVDNRTGESASLIGLGPDVDTGKSAIEVGLGPGPVRVACWPFSRHGKQESSEVPKVRLEITDPEGLYHSGELDCESDMVEGTIIDYGPTEGDHRSPEEIARSEVRNLQPDDVVEYVGYPEQKERSVRIVRDGKVLMVVGFEEVEDGGLIISGSSRCPETDLNV